MDHRRNDRRKNIFRKGIVILFWLCVWQSAAAMTHNRILLVGPVQAGAAFLENLVRPDFYKIVLFSFARIGAGFLLALFAGVLLGALSYRCRVSEMFLSPLITTLKAIPVASFVVLLLIWFGSGRLSFFISFLIVFPNIYVSTMAGLKNTDRKLLEMAQVFGMTGRNRLFYLYRPALMPYLVSSLEVSLGMSWKSGVAAEVIGIPAFSLGERLYMSKIYLDTAGLFAWTFLIIVLSFLFEKAVLYIVEKFADWKPYPRVESRKKGWIGRAEWKKDRAQRPERIREQAAQDNRIRLRDVGKTYGEQTVLKGISFVIEPGGHYCLMSPSGGGKTTLLNLMNRIVRADEGTIEGIPSRIGMVFQDDRLCDAYDTITNVMMTMYGTGKGNETDSCRSQGERRKETAAWIKEEALNILPADCLNKPVSELSGGMKRRCAILRAMLSGADIIIMDEPFTGLDEENRRKTAAYILERLHGRTLFVTTHREEDTALLEAVKIEL